MKSRKYRQKLILLFMVIIMGVLFQHSLSESSAKDIESHNHDILIVQSYHSGHKWESNVLEGIVNTIDSIKDDQIIAKVEYLDFRHNFEEIYINQFLNMLEVKYPKGSIDGIYAVDNEAFLVMKEKTLDKDSSFYQVPLLFSGVDGEIILSEEQKQYITGIYQRDDTVQLLNLILDIDEELSLLNVILEKSEYGQSVKNEINLQLDEHWEGIVEVNYIESDYIEDIEPRLAEAEFHSNSAVIIAGEFQYKDSGIYLEPEDTIGRIKTYTNNPIYSNDQTYLDSGILGGCVDIGQEHGENIINMFREIIKGKDIAELDTVLEPAAEKFINYPQIYEFGINPFDIPMYSIIRNKKFYELFVPTSLKYLLYVAMFGMVLLIINSVYNRKKLTIEKDKRIRQEELEKLRVDHIINMSHEFRTPLNIILSTVKLLDMKVRSGNVDADYILPRLDNISKNSFRLLRLVNNFIDISKSELGFLKVKLHDEDIVELTRNIFESVSDYCEKKEITLSFTTKEKELSMAIDKEKIQRVILNLLSNAIKFTDEGGSINGFLERDGDRVIIRVQDNGIGIPKDALDEIFFKFYQVDDILTRRSEGSGIGLSICKEIIELHQGEILVDSELGVGSTFSVRLPITNCNMKMTHQGEISSGNEVKLELSDID